MATRGTSADGTNTIKRCRVYGQNQATSSGVLYVGMYIQDVAEIRGGEVRDFNGTNGRGIHYALAAEDTDAVVTLHPETVTPKEVTSIRKCAPPRWGMC